MINHLKLWILPFAMAFSCSAAIYRDAKFLAGFFFVLAVFFCGEPLGDWFRRRDERRKHDGR